MAIDKDEMDAKLASLPVNRTSLSKEITPEQKKELVRLFRSLAPDRQKKVKALVNLSCSYCEREMGLPNEGTSHGLCYRHRAEEWRKLGKVAPEPKGVIPQDLRDFSPEELKVAAYFTLLSQAKDKKKWKP